MPYKIWVQLATVSYDVTIYSKAGASPFVFGYNLYYSEDNINWTYVTGPNLSTSCTQHTTVSISSGTIYLYADDDNANRVYIRGANSSTCPANLPVTCLYSTAITGTEDVAITVYVDGNGDYLLC